MKKLCLTLSLLLIAASAAFSQDDADISNPELTFNTETSQKKDKAYKYPKMDLEGKLYFLPSLTQMVSGQNPFLHLREDCSKVNQCRNFMIEIRGDILSIGDFAFSWSVGFNGYSETEVAPSERKYTYMGITTGAGVYFDPFVPLDDHSMHGLCVFLYPVYELPLYCDSDERFVHWKCAADLGINFTFLNVFTIYPYMRDIIAWTKNGVQFGLDFGLAFGVILPDLQYRGWKF